MDTQKFTKPDVRRLTRNTINRALGRMGLKLNRVGHAHQTMRDSLVQLRERGVRPKTVLDVGVGEGTSALYEVFPEALHVLVEPLSEFQEAIARIQKQVRAIYVPAAAGERAGQIDIFVKSFIEGSSAFLEEAGGQRVGTLRQVEVVALDDVVAKHQLEGPYLLKLDVEGAELQALAGAPELVQAAEAIILEVTFLPKLQGAPAFADIFRRMDAMGFAVYDVYDLSLRPTDGALFQANVTFVRNDSPLRVPHEGEADAPSRLVAEAK